MPTNATNFSNQMAAAFSNPDRIIILKIEKPNEANVRKLRRGKDTLIKDIENKRPEAIHCYSFKLHLINFFDHKGSWR